MQASHKDGLPSSSERAPRALSTILGNSRNITSATSSACSSNSLNESDPTNGCYSGDLSSSGPPLTPRPPAGQENTPVNGEHDSSSGGTTTTTAAAAAAAVAAAAAAEGDRATLTTPMVAQRPSMPVSTSSTSSSGSGAPLTAANVPRRPQPTDAPRKGLAPSRRPFVGSVSTAGFAPSDYHSSTSEVTAVDKTLFDLRVSTPSHRSIRALTFTQEEALVPSSSDVFGDSVGASTSSAAAAVGPTTVAPSGPSRPTDAPRKASRPAIGRLQFAASSISSTAAVAAATGTDDGTTAEGSSTPPEDLFNESVTLQPSMLFSPRPPGADVDSFPTTTPPARRQRLLFSPYDESTTEQSAAALSNDVVSFSTDSIDSPYFTTFSAPAAAAAAASVDAETNAIDVTGAPTLEMAQLMEGLCEPSTPCIGASSPSSSLLLSPLRAEGSEEEDGPARSLLASLQAAPEDTAASSPNDKRAAAVPGAASANASSTLSPSSLSSPSLASVEVIAETSRSLQAQGPRRRLFRNSRLTPQSNNTANVNTSSSNSNTSSDRIARNGPSGSGQRRSWLHNPAAPGSSALATATGAAGAAAAIAEPVNSSEDVRGDDDGEEARCAWEAQNASSSSYADNPYMIATSTTTTTIASPPTTSSAAPAATATAAHAASADMRNNNSDDGSGPNVDSAGPIPHQHQPTPPASSRIALPQQQQRPVRPSFRGCRPVNNATASAPRTVTNPADTSTDPPSQQQQFGQLQVGFASPSSSSSSPRETSSSEALAFEEAADRVRAQEGRALRLAAVSGTPPESVSTPVSTPASPAAAAVATAAAAAAAPMMTKTASTCRASYPATAQSLEFFPTIRPNSSAATSKEVNLAKESRPEHEYGNELASNDQEDEKNEDDAAAAFERRRAQQLEAMRQFNTIPEQRQRIALQQRVRIAQRGSQNETMSLSDRAAARMAARAASSSSSPSSSTSVVTPSLATRPQASPSPTTATQAALFKAQWNSSQLASPVSSTGPSLSTKHGNGGIAAAETAMENAHAFLLPPATSSSTSPPSSLSSYSSFSSPTSSTATAATAAAAASILSQSSRTSLAATGQKGQGGGPYDVYASSPIRVAPQRRELLTASPSATLSSLASATKDNMSASSALGRETSFQRSARSIAFSLDEEAAGNRKTSSSSTDRQRSPTVDSIAAAECGNASGTAFAAGESQSDETASVIAAAPATPLREEPLSPSALMTTSSSDNTTVSSEGGGALRIVSGPLIGSPLQASPQQLTAGEKKGDAEGKGAEKTAAETVATTAPHAPIHMLFVAKTPIQGSRHGNNRSNSKLSATSKSATAVAAAAATPTGVEGLDAALGLMSPMNMRSTNTSSAGQTQPDSKSSASSITSPALSLSAAVATSSLSLPSTLASLKDLPPLPGMNASIVQDQDQHQQQQQQQKDANNWNLCDRPGRATNNFQTLLEVNGESSRNQGAAKSENGSATTTITRSIQAGTYDTSSERGSVNPKPQNLHPEDGKASSASMGAVLDQSQGKPAHRNLNLGKHCPQGEGPTGSPPQLVRPSLSVQAEVDERRFAALRQSQRFSSSFQYTQRGDDDDGASTAANMELEKAEAVAALPHNGPAASVRAPSASRLRKAGRTLRPASSSFAAAADEGGIQEGISGFTKGRSCDEGAFRGEKSAGLASGIMDLRRVAGH